jgi:hypothetical protein
MVEDVFGSIKSPCIPGPFTTGATKRFTGTCSVVPGVVAQRTRRPVRLALVSTTISNGLVSSGTRTILVEIEVALGGGSQGHQAACGVVCRSRYARADPLSSPAPAEKKRVAEPFFKIVIEKKS